MLAALAVLSLCLGALSFAAADTACDGACAKTYDKCVGRDIFSLKSCCDSRDHCVKFSKWYGQCRPKSNTRYEDDWLGTTVDCRLCGVSTLVPNTEFNFEEDIYCEVNYIGSYSLQECARVCAEGPYVACDRYNGGTPFDEVSCYGYTELFEGGCFKQVHDDYYDSWLNCKGNGPVVQPIGVADEAPAALSIEVLEADIAADEASTSTEKAVKQKAKDVASRRRK